MLNFGPVTVGWERELSIPEALQRLGPLVSECSTALITCIDSTRGKELTRVPDALWPAGFDFTPHRLGLIVSGPALAACVELLFSGFDEVWLFRSPPTVYPDELPRLTSEEPIDTPRPAYLAKLAAACAWFPQAAGVAAFGDGCGLNYVAADSRVASHLLADRL